MATTARVVHMKADGVVEPEKPAEVGELLIDGSAEPGFAMRTGFGR